MRLSPRADSGDTSGWNYRSDGPRIDGLEALPGSGAQLFEARTAYWYHLVLHAEFGGIRSRIRCAVT